MSHAVLLSALRECAGQIAVHSGESPGYRFADGHAPRAVVDPATTEEAAAVLALCSAERWRTAFAGGGTWLHARPRGPVDVLVTTRRLGPDVAHAPADLTASVAAGTPLDVLQATCRRQRQHWPVDAPGAAEATAGAVVANGSAGPTRFAAGTPRDHVLGLELVTGDGRVLALGGRVVKNVAGYDLVRLVVGSAGQLGLITRLELRLRPVPAHEVTAVYVGPEPEPLIELALQATEAWPAAIELVSPTVAHAALDTLHWALLVRCAGNRTFVEEARARLERLRPDRVELPGRDAATAAWSRLRDAETETTALVRVAGLSASLRATLAAAHEIIADDAGRWRLACHAGDGIVRAWRSDAVDADRGRRLAEAIDNMRARDDTLHVSMPVTPPGMPAGFAAAPQPPVALRLSAALRSAFDPAGILAGAGNEGGA